MDFSKLFSAESVELASTLMEELGVKDKDFEKIEAEIKDWADKNNYTQMNLVYYGEPKAQARPRKSGANGFFYDPSKGLKQWLLAQIVSQLPPNFKPLEVALEVDMRFYRAMPTGGSKKDKILMELGVLRPIGRPDIDNYIKLVQDALNKTLYKDDSNIVTLRAEKYYSCKPRVEIDIKFRKASQTP
jgi:Holliday junction resolvase RusA-like endonuclease